MQTRKRYIFFPYHRDIFGIFIFSEINAFVGAGMSKYFPHCTAYVCAACIAWTSTSKRESSHDFFSLLFNIVYSKTVSWSTRETIASFGRPSRRKVFSRDGELWRNKGPIFRKTFCHRPTHPGIYASSLFFPMLSNILLRYEENNHSSMRIENLMKHFFSEMKN